MAESERLKRYYNANRKARLEYAARHRDSKSQEIAKYQRSYWEQNQDVLKRYQRAYRDQNAERLAAQKHDYWHNNKAEITRKLRQYWKRNPDKRRPWDWIAPADRLTIYERDGFTCHLCGLLVALDASFPEPDSPSLDHIIPRSTGGTDEVNNLRTAHLRCNIRRGTKPVSVARALLAGGITL